MFLSARPDWSQRDRARRREQRPLRADQRRHSGGRGAADPFGARPRNHVLRWRGHLRRRRRACLPRGWQNGGHDVVLSTKIHLGPDPFRSRTLRWRTAHRPGMARRLGSVCSRNDSRSEWNGPSGRCGRTGSTCFTCTQSLRASIRWRSRRVLPELLKMKEEGKLRAIGVTEGFLADPNHEMLRAASNKAHFDVIMVGIQPQAIRARPSSSCPPPTKADIGVDRNVRIAPTAGHCRRQQTRLRRVAEEAGAYQPVGPRLSLLPAPSRDRCRYDGTGDPAHLRPNIAAVIGAAPAGAQVLVRLRQLTAVRDQPDAASTRK